MIRSITGNKKAWIKIAEAFIAVMLISVIILTVYAGKTRTKTNENIIKIEDNLLDEIVQNGNYRMEIIIRNNADSISTWVSGKLPAYLDFKVRICNVDEICSICGVDEICSPDNYLKEVYARERIVSSTWSQYSPKKLKIFMWEK